MTIEERLAERPDIAKCRDVIDRARGSGLNKVRLSAFDEVAAYAELLEARVESAERRAAEQVEMFERQAAAVRHHTVRADAAEHQRDRAIMLRQAVEHQRDAATAAMEDREKLLAAATRAGQQILDRLYGLEAALATFGKHPTTCTAWRTTFWKPPLECDCGLAAALENPTATEGG